ncbi:MAG: hypothetical protein IPH28_17045 [Cytophagaceae bacterium]|nr:hypothetical protein [Cytophagaceae bacterium]
MGIQNPTLLNVSPSEEGIYTLTVNDGIACSATATVQLTLTPDVSTPVFSLGVSSTRCQE